MEDYLKMDSAAEKVREAVEHAIENKFVTIDLDPDSKHSTAEVGDFISDYIRFSQKSYYNYENVKLGKSTIV